MNKRLRSALAGLAAGAGIMAGAQAASGETLSISCGAVGQELELCREGVEAWAKETGHEVKVISTPNSTTERLALYQQVLAAGTSDIDVYQVDVIWPGILANHFLDLNPSLGDAAKGHFPSIVANNTVKGRLVAMPLYTDAGLLYYRRDLLEKHGQKCWNLGRAEPKRQIDPGGGTGRRA